MNATFNVLVTGCSSGIGEAIAVALSDNRSMRIFGTYHNQPSEIIKRINTEREAIGTDREITQYQIDFTASALEYALPEIDIDILINCAGINYINWLQDTPEYWWDKVMTVNAKSIFMLSKFYYHSLVENQGAIMNIISNASHMPMTNSIAYNASKGAAHIMTLQLSRELAPQGVTVFGLSPNKVAGTEMSEYIDNTVPALRGWTKEQAREYQIKALPAGKETDRWAIARLVSFLFSHKQNYIYLNGCVIPYGK